MTAAPDETATNLVGQLTRVRHSLFDAQLAVLGTLDPRSAARLADSRATRAVELVELIGAAIAHCERLMVVVEGDQRAEQPAGQVAR